MQARPEGHPGILGSGWVTQVYPGAGYGFVVVWGSAVCSSWNADEDAPAFYGGSRQQNSTSISRNLICLCLFHRPVLRRLGLRKYWGPSYLHLSFHEMKLPPVFLLNPLPRGSLSSAAFQSNRRQKHGPGTRTSHQPCHTYILQPAPAKAIMDLLCWSCLKWKTIL